MQLLPLVGEEAVVRVRPGIAHWRRSSYDVAECPADELLNTFKHKGPVYLLAAVGDVQKTSLQSLPERQVAFDRNILAFSRKKINFCYNSKFTSSTSILYFFFFKI